MRRTLVSIAVCTLASTAWAGEPGPDGGVPAPLPDPAPAPALVTTSAPKAAPAPVQLTVDPGKGVTIASPDGRYAVNLRSRIQVRDTVTLGSAPMNDLQLK